jgi:hypothetical protein
MTLRIIGEHPLATNGDGALKSRIATLFPRAGVLVTLPGIHATQRLAYVQELNQERQQTGHPPLTEEEEAQEWEQSVDLITESNRILIRPDPDNMPLAFEADEALQELVSKQKVRYLLQSDPRVRQAIKERGECWRINPLPQTASDMTQMIRNARMRVATTVVYYYNHITGTKHLTLQEFARLEALPPEGLARALQEIRELAQRHNRLFNVEVDFFGVAESPLGQGWVDDLPGADPALVRKYYLETLARFHAAVPPDLREDNPDQLAWRNRMFSALVGERDQSPSEEILLGLSPEFFMQLEWLPGGRIVHGELIFDPIFDESERRPDDPELRSLCDERAKGFIFNFLREFTDIEYINVGRVVTSLSRRGVFAGRRGVFIAEMKRRDAARPIVRILRMQKWGIWEHLDENKDLCWAIMESEDYTDYILDRRLGCRQLGMNLPPQVSTRRIMEAYTGVNHAYQGRRIWATYFEREYVRGVASDKVQPSRYANGEFCRRFARLLGQAAATNLIIGRMTTDTQAVLFDDGDEIIIEDEHGLPLDLVVSDHTGTFADFKTDLALFAADYAQPINRRLKLLANPEEFIEIYLTTFQARFLEIQDEYRKRRHAFLSLFKLLHRDEPGGFGFRWERVLARLDATDAAALTAAVRAHVSFPTASQPAHPKKIGAQPP